MRKILIASAAVLALSTGASFAQTTYQSTTTTATAPQTVYVPPPGSLSIERTQKTVNPDGSQTQTHSTTYRNSEGVANESTTTTVAPPPAVTTTRRTTTTTIQN